MTRAIFDLQQYWNTNFVFGTLNALITVGTEALTEKPPIILESSKIINPPTLTDNCLISLTTEQEGLSIELGDFRHEVYFIDGYIYYESRDDLTDEMIMALRGYLRTLLNTNNNSPSRSYSWTYEGTEYNESPIAGKIDFTVRATKTDVSAIA